MNAIISKPHASINYTSLNKTNQENMNTQSKVDYPISEHYQMKNL